MTFTKQYIYFLDPKSVLMGETYSNHPKIIWCRGDAKALETKIQEDLNRENMDIQIHISAYILSVTSHEEVRK